MRFDVEVHRAAWDTLDRVAHAMPDVDPVGRTHNGLEEILNACALNRSRDYLIIEIGSELGGSTRFFLEYLPKSLVVCIDPWPTGYKLPRDFSALAPYTERREDWLYHLFLHFCRDYRERILPIRTFSSQGIVRAAAMGLAPDIVYIDGDHRYVGTLNDLILVHSLFPSATIIGDDWNFSSQHPVYKGIEKSVQKAAIDFVDHFGLALRHISNTYLVQPNADEEHVALNYTVPRS